MIHDIDRFNGNRNNGVFCCVSLQLPHKLANPNPY